MALAVTVLGPPCEDIPKSVIFTAKGNSKVAASNTTIIL